jgi:ElaB/YqjD/DUF883 family membrane-anchored ribosome-binding protein
MEETRSALTEKLETLEERVVGTVEAVQSTVENTVETVKETVQDTVKTVKRTFDIPYQVEQRPWLMLGGSVVVGYLLGSLRGREVYGPARPYAASTNGRSHESAAPGPRATDGAYAAAGWPEPRPQPATSGLWQKFGDELQGLQGLAVSAVAGMIRDWLSQSYPGLEPQVTKVMDSVTTKLGGEPLRGPLFPPSQEQPVGMPGQMAD